MRYIFILLFIVNLISCDDVRKQLGMNMPRPAVDTMMYSEVTKVIFHDTMIDLGIIKEGSVKQLVFHYENVGAKPLMLFNVSPGCGCTIADYSHNPLMPGKRDSIIAKFDSKGKEGSYIKNIKVNCNSEEKVHNIAFSVQVNK
jgi:uncharacterized protein YbbK (DUF523 family)